MSSTRRPSRGGAWAGGLGCLFVVVLVLGVVAGIAAWVPIAQEHQEEEGESQQSTAAVGVELAPGSVPQEYHALLEEWGRYCPTLTGPRLAAQIQQESGWRADARSPAGAQGIAQFMPGTWDTHGTDANGDGHADVWDPEDAIPSAAIYDCAVARQVRDVPGDPVDNMLAAYNSGPGAVQQYGGVPPYEETQNYVRTIRALESTLAAALERGSEPPASEVGARIVALARQEIGMPYLWGGDGPPAGEAGWDCSGLTRWAVREATGGRVEIPRVSSDQRTAGDQVPRDAMRPGDLIVIDHDGAWGHVGIYAGNGQMVHAPRTGRNVEQTPLAGYWERFDWDIRRVA